MESIMGSFITGILAFAGVVVSVIFSNRKIEHQLDKQQAVMDAKLEELTREVRAHNNFAQKVPVLEEKVNNMLNRVMELEKKLH